MEAYLSGHGAYRTEYHIVWIQKYQRRILNPGVKGYLIKLFPKITRGMPGCYITEYNIMIDHIHMVMIIPPKYAVSDVIKKIKGVTSVNLRKKFDWLKKVYWSDGFFVNTVSKFGSEDTISKYARNQGMEKEFCYL